MKLNFLQKTVIITASIATCSFAVNRPYPQGIDFPGCIKPNNVTQTQMNNSVSSLYDSYKSRYLKTLNGDRYYILAQGNPAVAERTISEAHGYGMIIMALMAGYDADAQTQFDGMCNYFDQSRSNINGELMAWDGSNRGNDAATDGDMDIAYALILADKQWGSTGSINYLARAKTLIEDGIKASEMGQYTARTLLGDWDDDGETTRSSDWMTGHMRAFNSATGDNFWLDAADTVYSLISELTTTYAPQTGLLPCFIDGASPYPDASGGGTGEDDADKYSYNACRVPWRLALDYAHNGTPEAKSTTSKMLGWLRTKTNGNVNEIMAGYTLDGNTFIQNGSSAPYADLVFNAPFAAGAITDDSNQDFLNSLWEINESNEGINEYGHALNILSMLLISGNWWSPTEFVYREPTKVLLNRNSISEKKSAGSFIGKLSTDGNGYPMTYSLVEGNNDFRISSDSLFSARIFDADVSNSLPLKVKVTDNENATATTPFTVSISKVGENIVHAVNWEVAHDSYMHTSVDTGASLVSENVAVTFNIGWSQGQNYVYGTLKTSVFDSPLSSYDSISVKYKSDDNFKLTLPMSTVRDDAYHAAELPNTNSQWSEITLPISSLRFNQPTDWGTPVQFDASKITSLSFDAGFEGVSGRIEVESISFKTDNSSSISGGFIRNNNQFNITITGKQMNLTVPITGNYNIAIYSLNGQLLREFTRNIGTESSSISLDGLSNQMFIVQLSGAGQQAVFKGLIK